MSSDQRKKKLIFCSQDKFPLTPFPSRYTLPFSPCNSGSEVNDRQDRVEDEVQFDDTSKVNSECNSALGSWKNYCSFYCNSCCPFHVKF